MVAASVPRLGYVLKPCLARPMLFAALDCYDKGDYIGAGVRLRESVLRFVVSACDWYDCQPKNTKYPRPVDYIRALHKAKQLDKWDMECLLEMIDAGNKLAHCQRVCPGEVRGGIAILFAMMDGQPYCPADRNPIVTSKQLNPYDIDDCDDDDDSADFWKGGAV